MCMGGGGGGGGAAARAEADQAEKDARREEEIRRGRDDISQAFSGFDDNFFRDREDAFTQNAVPQLDRQWGDARKSLIYQLADAGTLRSGTAATRLGDLERDYNDRRLQLADEARADGTRVRNDLEGARTNLVNTLIAAGDASGTSQAAAQQAQIASQAPTYSPIAQVFQNVGAGVGVARNARDAQAVRDGTYGTRLFQTGTTGSSKLVA